MKTLKSNIKTFIPPVLLTLKQKFIAPRGIEFDGIFNSFELVPDDNIWESREWIELSERKLMNYLDHIPEGRYFTDPLILLANLETIGKTCNVLDLGGGTGYVYFRLRSSFVRPSSILWHVVDNPKLMALGKAKKGRASINFHNEISDVVRADIIYINTSVQYFRGWEKIFDGFLNKKPSYVILTRLLCSSGNTIITRQNILGKHTPCVFVSYEELVNFMISAGYRIIYDLPCWEEDLKEVMSKSVRDSVGEHPSRDMVFARDAEQWRSP